MCIVPEGSRLSDREQSFHTMVLVLTTRTSKIISYKRENALSTGLVPKKKKSLTKSTVLKTQEILLQREINGKLIALDTFNK